MSAHRLMLISAAAAIASRMSSYRFWALSNGSRRRSSIKRVTAATRSSGFGGAVSPACAFFSSRRLSASAMVFLFSQFVNQVWISAYGRFSWSSGTAGAISLSKKAIPEASLRSASVESWRAAARSRSASTKLSSCEKSSFGSASKLASSLATISAVRERLLDSAASSSLSFSSAGMRRFTWGSVRAIPNYCSTVLALHKAR